MSDGIDWASLSKQAAAAFDPVPAGDYNATITECTATTASTGKPMLKAKFRINGGPHDGRIVFNNFTITADNPNAMGFFFRHMKALGLDADFFATSPSMPKVADAMAGRPATITVGIRQYQGQDQNELKTIKPGGSGPVGLLGAGTALPGSSPAGIPTGSPVASGGIPSGTPVPPAAVQPTEPF